MNPLSVSPARLRRLRRITLALPEAIEQEAWGDPTWRVRGKIFAMQKGNHAGGRPSLWVKAAPGEQATMVEARPDLYFVPPYVGPRGWVGIHLDGEVDWAALEEAVHESYRLIAPRRLGGAASGRPASLRPRRSSSAGPRPPSARAPRRAR